MSVLGDVSGVELGLSGDLRGPEKELLRERGFGIGDGSLPPAFTDALLSFGNPVTVL